MRTALHFDPRARARARSIYRFSGSRCSPANDRRWHLEGRIIYRLFVAYTAAIIKSE